MGRLAQQASANRGLLRNPERYDAPFVAKAREVLQVLGHALVTTEQSFAEFGAASHGTASYVPASRSSLIQFVRDLEKGEPIPAETVEQVAIECRRLLADCKTHDRLRRRAVEALRAVEQAQRRQAAAVDPHGEAV